MAIISRSTGQTVGMATINGVNWTHRRAAIGYWILNRYRRHGFARSAVSLLPGLARELGLIRLEALIEPGNHASQAVCRALGFTEEGTLHSYYQIGGQNPGHGRVRSDPAAHLTSEPMRPDATTGSGPLRARHSDSSDI